MIWATIFISKLQTLSMALHIILREKKKKTTSMNIPREENAYFGKRKRP